MKKIIFLDTETTGNEPKKDFLCQLAYKTDSETFCELYKPSIPIPPEASAVTHITNKMVADKNVFKESPEYNKIKSLLESKDSVMVAHNNKFDYEIIKKEDITPANTICTLRVARALDKNNIIPQYRLQYLRYYLDIDIEADAHDALGDVLVLEKLYERLLDKIMKEDEERALKDGEQYDFAKSEAQAIEKMIEISSKPSMMNLFNFGKYAGKTVADVARVDRGYLEWMLNQKEQSGSDNEEDWIYTLKHHLGRLL
ncbi:MAG: 3'-5' exonuclease [Candidatus Nomurabacteria bacterium]|nr:3'-5' exonuclease [Candidatus Nomurabacteria bacterium]